MPKVSKEAIKHFLGSSTAGGDVASKEELIRWRKEARLKKIAKRIFWKRARPEELIIFEQYKKDLRVKDVVWDNYNKIMVLE